MKNIIKYIAIIIIITIVYTNYSYKKFGEKELIKENKIIHIQKWENIKDLASKLDLNHYFLKKYIKNNKKDFILLAWKFEMKKSFDIKQILDSLEKPISEKQTELTIIEWWNIYDIDDYLYQKKLIEKDDYINYVQNPEKIKALKEFYDFLNLELISLEWYLYPDTYILKTPLKINELVIKQLDTFENKAYKKILKPENLSNQTIYDVVNLASIVEKEEKNNKEKSTVAGILKKRLQSWWSIGADITVCYPHKLTSQECKLVVSKYIQEKSDYNTRTMIGLPKTPISNPSSITINATLNDKKTSFWYYLHNVKTWKIYYSETNRQHEENKKYMY